MARYRLGNSYLSEEEYERVLNERFGCIAALVVALVVAVTTAALVVEPGWPKIIRFALIGGSSLLASAIVYRFASVLRSFLTLIVAFAVIAGALYLLWRVS